MLTRSLACSPTCLLACLFAWLLACLLACLFACLLARARIRDIRCMQRGWWARMCTHIKTYVRAKLLFGNGCLVSASATSCRPPAIRAVLAGLALGEPLSPSVAGCRASPPLPHSSTCAPGAARAAPAEIRIGAPPSRIAAPALALPAGAPLCGAWWGDTPHHRTPQGPPAPGSRSRTTRRRSPLH